VLVLVLVAERGGFKRLARFLSAFGLVGRGDVHEHEHEHEHVNVNVSVNVK